ncbi:MAG: ABC transporter ATP-binding protein [Clostridia bacterium]|nr:ABC transporter ATP-binding protein [Clostridia bacterium]
MLKIENFTKRYGDITAVSDLSLHIAPGEIFGFIGHNGAGKTTTLKAAAGILPYETGSITVGGIPMEKDPLAAKALMAYLPDNPDLYEFMSGEKYLHFIADIYGVGEERNDRIATLADAFRITEALSRPISTLSHGMKQKIAILSAFVHAPRLILMDEPFVGLDPSAAHTLKEMMREHCRAGGAIFFSTHVLDTAEKLCDRIAIIKGGRLLVSGRTEEVRGDASLEDVFLELADSEKEDA